MTSELKEQTLIMYTPAGLEKVSSMPQAKASRGEKVAPLRLIKLELLTQRPDCVCEMPEDLEEHRI